jgi:3-methyladenine DNA glycosylase Tag
MIADENQRVKRDWEEFNKSFEYKHSPERIAAMQESMLNRIASTEQILKQLWTVESTPMTVTPYHSLLLSLHGINSEEIALSPAFSTLYYNDYIEQLSRIRTAIMEPSALNRRFVNTLFEVFDHTLNSYYVSLLSELSLFPKNSRKTFNKMRPQWSYFPQSYNIDQDRGYYEDIIETENRLANELLAQYRSVLMEQDSELEDIIRENEELKQKVTEVEAAKTAAEEQVTKVKSQVEELTAEVTSLKDEVSSAKDETDAVKEDLAKSQKLVEQLKTRLQSQQQPVAAQAASGGVSAAQVTAGNKGKVVAVNDEGMFAVVEMSDDAMNELIGEERKNGLPLIEMALRRAGFNGPSGEYIGRIRLRQAISGKNLVIVDVLGDWKQSDIKVGDVVFAE